MKYKVLEKHVCKGQVFRERDTACEFCLDDASNKLCPNYQELYYKKFVVNDMVKPYERKR